MSVAKKGYQVALAVTVMGQAVTQAARDGGLSRQAFHASAGGGLHG